MTHSLSSGPADAPELDNELWRFVGSLYAREGVSHACLTLQDKLGVDVDILLFAIFAQVKRGILLDTDDLASVDNLIRDWRSEIVQVLRRVRTRLKAGPAPAPSAATETLRNRIKAAELEAEQFELAVLANWLEQQPRPGAGGDVRIVTLRVAHYFYAQGTEKPFPTEVADALAALARASEEMIPG